MTEKNYKILLDNKLIGTIKLEYGDPPMGVVFGQTNFIVNNMIKFFCYYRIFIKTA